MSTAVLKDRALQTYYESLFDLYGTPGWRVLMEDLGQMIASHSSFAGVDTVEQLWFRKGQLNQIEWLANHRAAAEHAYQALLEEQENAEQPEPTGGRARIVEPGESAQ